MPRDAAQVPTLLHPCIPKYFVTQQHGQLTFCFANATAPPGAVRTESSNPAPDTQNHPLPTHLSRLRGAEMESGECQFLFKETRLNLEPSSSALVTNIRVPAPSSHGRTHRRSALTDGRGLDEETTFALKILAPASSIYQRQWSGSPSNFLWRVLEDGLVLSVRAVDVCKQQKDPDAALVLNFNFTVPILPSCVALTDPQGHDALYIYVIDKANHLYYFTLRSDLFRRRASLDSTLTDVCGVYLPPSLASKQPHRLLAINHDKLLVTLHDGGLVKLDRNRGSDCTYDPSYCMLTINANVQFSRIEPVARVELQLPDVDARPPKPFAHSLQ